MTKFFEENKFHAPRLVGDELNELIEEAIKYVTKDHRFYRRHIEEDLTEKQRVVVSYHSSYTRGLEIYLDKTRRISDYDFDNLYSNDLGLKYDLPL
jgi:hypothetical protein